jgi:DNA-binding MarR family transcriptional regulator
MQRLQNASDPSACAESLIEAALDVVLLLRESTARGQDKTGAPTLIHVRAMGILRKRPGASLSALAAQLALTLSATSRLVTGLVEQGYVAREIPAGNRRTVALHVTPAGAKIHARARGLARSELARLLSSLSPAQRSALSRSALTLRQIIESTAP